MQTIMIVEDDPDIRDGVRILLSGEGYRILEAENGPRALSLLTPEVDSESSAHLHCLGQRLPLCGAGHFRPLRQRERQSRACL